MIKYLIFILQLLSIHSFNFKKMTASLLLSSTLNNPQIHDSEKIQKPPIMKVSNNNIRNSMNLESNENEYNQFTNIKIIDNNIYFYGPITSQSCRELNDALILLDQNSKIFSNNFGIDKVPINLHIQSEGGSLMNTFYVIDLINNLDTPVYTYVDGYVASAGSLISVIGKKRFMTKNSFIMIHQLSSSLGEGKFNEFDDNMDNLNKFMDTIRNIYVEKTKIPINDLNDILDRDLWMNSKESLEYGLVDYII